MTCTHCISECCHCVEKSANMRHRFSAWATNLFKIKIQQTDVWNHRAAFFCFPLLSIVVISCVRSCVWQRKVQSRSTTTIISKLWTAIAASSASIIPLFSFNIYARLEKQERKPFGKNCECDEKAVQRRSLFFFSNLSSSALLHT